MIPMAGKWVQDIFKSNIAKRGGIVRRKVNSIQRYASLDEVKQECGSRGFHIIAHGDQWLIFCDKAHVKLIL
jgi:hypothetical protein